jgi:iron complex transport system substrate-binding protein
MTLPEDEARRTTRRQFVVGGLGALASVPILLAACGGDDEAAPADAAEAPAATGAATEATGPWSFTDDFGNVVELPSPPQKVVAEQDAAAALWELGIVPVGVFAGTPLADVPQFEGRDVSGIATVGEVYGELNLEVLAGLEPDLIVTARVADFPLRGFTDDKQVETVAAIAPIIAFNASRPATEVLQRLEELATSLGADVEAPEVAEIRSRFDEAVAALQAAAAEKPGLTVLAASATPDNFYAANPGDFTDLQEYQRWGVEMVVPTGKEPFFQVLSWEQADKYPADLIFFDSRPGLLEAAAEKPTWQALPAVQAGQVVRWLPVTVVTYEWFTRDIEALAAGITSANADVVS